MTQTEKSTRRHPFSFTLGEGPYEFVGIYDLGEALARVTEGLCGTQDALRDAPKLEKGCGSCAHCGHGILTICIVRSGDGKLYGVGSDCVEKVNAEGDISKISDMEHKLRRLASDKRRAKNQAKIDALRPEYEKALVVLATKPHPNDYFASKGKTAADYFRFCSKNPKNMKAAIALAGAV